MDPTLQYKQCPQCQQLAPIGAPTCAHCGRQFRTQFAPPLDQTRLVSAPLPPAAAAPQVPAAAPQYAGPMSQFPVAAPPATRNWGLVIALASVTLVTAIVGIVILLMSHPSQTAGTRPSEQSVSSTEPSHDPASGNAAANAPSEASGNAPANTPSVASVNAPASASANAPGNAPTTNGPSGLSVAKVMRAIASGNIPTGNGPPAPSNMDELLRRPISGEPSSKPGESPAGSSATGGKKAHGEVLPCGHPRVDQAGKHAEYAVCEQGEVFQRSEGHWVPTDKMEVQGSHPSTGSLPPSNFNLLSPHAPVYVGPVQRATGRNTPRR